MRTAVSVVLAPAATANSAASAFGWPGTNCKPVHSARPNAGTSITNIGIPSVLDPESWWRVMSDDHFES
jgi:hypothetical protein